MSLGSRLLNQFRKPEGRLGRLNLWSMNRRHSRLTDWGLRNVRIASRDTILDVGCGGGRTVGKLASIAVVTAVETHYWWPDLPAGLRDVLRVLKPGGTLAIVAEAYRGGKYDALLKRLEEVRKTISYGHLSVDEHRALLEGAGYADVRVVEEWDKGWLCATGRKPS